MVNLDKKKKKKKKKTASLRRIFRRIFTSFFLLLFPPLSFSLACVPWARLVGEEKEFGGKCASKIRVWVPRWSVAEARWPSQTLLPLPTPALPAPLRPHGGGHRRVKDRLGRSWMFGWSVGVLGGMGWCYCTAGGVFCGALPPSADKKSARRRWLIFLIVGSGLVAVITGTTTPHPPLPSLTSLPPSFSSFYSLSFLIPSSVLHSSFVPASCLFFCLSLQYKEWINLYNRLNEGVVLSFIFIYFLHILYLKWK